ncbi:hypothetical protein C5S30_06250 [ANME-1 cluster archaeon GoMg4]|nr:hypothetical protein [ANME-1 cluster archaeon GoMg4]
MHPYPENWDEIRKRIYRRDGWQCQKCGATNVQLHAHHIIPLSQGGSNEPDNLITLCKNCHAELHPLTTIWWDRLAEKHPTMNLIFRIAQILFFLFILWMIIRSVLF